LRFTFCYWNKVAPKLTNGFHLLFRKYIEKLIDLLKFGDVGEKLFGINAVFINIFEIG
jgi:hypothetical protein